MDVSPPTTTDCRRCGAELVRLYGAADADPVDVLPLMSPEDSEDLLTLTNLEARDEAAAAGHPPTCANCRANLGAP